MARVVLRSEETAGAVSIIELSSNAGWPGPPLHRHDFDEAFYVTEGELTFQLGEEVFTRGPAGSPSRRATSRTPTPTTATRRRALLVCTPAGFERYFARMAAEATGVEPPEWALQPTPPVEHLGPQIARRA